MIGTYQSVFDWCERERTNIEWEACNRDLARHLVSGISEHEAEEEGPSYDTRGENVKGLPYEIRSEYDNRQQSNEGPVLAVSGLIARPLYQDFR